MPAVLQKASNVVVVCVTLIAAMLILGMVFLIYKGRADLKDAMTLVTGLGAAFAWLYSSAGANSGHNVEKQLNGQLDARLKALLAEHDAEVHGSAPTVPPPSNAAVPFPDQPSAPGGISRPEV